MSKINRQMRATVKKIEDLREQMQALNDEELKNLTGTFKNRLQKGEKINHLIPEAFAAVREAARRTLGMEHFPVQLLGGIVLHKGYIAEMKTGEGKTLVSALPAYLNALEGEGVHIVTVNDYLAKRDATMMGKVYAALGLSTGVILSGMDNRMRKKAYACDITYVTNSEVGFDYLRDNMASQKEDRVLRGLHYAIIDEVDSILIDEARTPLIISGKGRNATKLYQACDILAKEMVRGKGNGEYTKMDAIMGVPVDEDGDFIVNEKDKYVALTLEGVKKAEIFFHIDNLADPENLDKQHTLLLALRANNLMKRDIDYVVKNNEVLIVDTFTGRILPGRRYSDGLHQAIEAKEGVKIKPESRTHATITFQNFFNMYDKKCGMTGTAMTEQREFFNTYRLHCIELPTNKPVIRKDLEDAMYKTKKEKYNAVVEDVRAAHKKGQPVLIGTATIEVSEELSRYLKKAGISHRVLNAKQNEQEAMIVAEAGKAGAVTIATNMAGRGTDIKLDDEAKAAGGLKVIGTERHESRRIDNQLRGRSGRQGDPGESRFYLSLQDDLMRLFGSERMMRVFESTGIEEGEPVEHRMLTRSIGKAQKRIEGNNFVIRKNLLDFDKVKGEQRDLIYRERDRILNSDDISASIKNMILLIINDTVERSNGMINQIKDLLDPIIPLPTYEYKRSIHLKKDLYKAALELYREKEQEFDDEELIRSTERQLLLHEIDDHWMDHIDDLDILQEGIELQGYAQKDPIVVYKTQAYQLFDEMLMNICRETLTIMYHVKVRNSMPVEN